MVAVALGLSAPELELTDAVATPPTVLVIATGGDVADADKVMEMDFGAEVVEEAEVVADVLLVVLM